MQATLSIDASPGQKAALKCKVEGAEEVLICSLREGAQESTNLDLILDSYTEFSLVSKPKSTSISIHLAGYLIADSDEEEEAEEEDGTCCGLDHDHHHHHHTLQGQFHIGCIALALHSGICSSCLGGKIALKIHVLIHSMNTPSHISMIKNSGQVSCSCL